MLFLLQQLQESSEFNLRKFMLEAQQLMVDEDMTVKITKIIDTPTTKQFFFTVDGEEQPIDFYANFFKHKLKKLGIQGYLWRREFNGELHDHRAYVSETKFGGFETPKELMLCVSSNIPTGAP